MVWQAKPKGNDGSEIVEKQRIEIAMLRGAAMTNGYGMWLTEPNGSNQFVLTTSKAVYTNELRMDPKVFAGYMMEMKEMTVAYQGTIEKLADITTNLSGVANEVRGSGLSLKTQIRGIEKVVGVSTGNVVQTQPRAIVEVHEPFTAEDWGLSKKVGYDLEKEIKKSLGGMIEFEVEGWDGKDKALLVDKLQKATDNLVNRSFEGFKTYNGLRR